MIQGVLFDMDGVLFNTERVYIWAEAEAGRRVGEPRITEAYCKQFCGMSSKLVKEALVRDMGLDFDVENYRALSKQLTFDRVDREGLQPMPHVAETLAWLTGNGYKTSVASSTKTEIVQDYLQRAGFTPYFDAVVGGDQVRNGKPNPDIFLHAAGLLGLKPEQCVGVEDSFNGIRAVHAAGCVAVMIPDVLEPDDEMREKATILTDMSGLPAFIQGLNA